MLYIYGVKLSALGYIQSLSDGLSRHKKADMRGKQG